MTHRFPGEICSACQASADDHWLADRLFYCEHRRVMVWRGDPADAWTVVKNATPAMLCKALAIAQRVIAEHAEKTGLTLREADQLMTLARKLGVDRGNGLDG